MKFLFYPTAMALLTILLLTFASTAPVSNESNTFLPIASISITNFTTTPSITATSNPVAAKTLADDMSGTTATASISIIGQDITAHNSGADRSLAGIAILPLALISALFLI